jgi:RHS repeat-associated protein
VPPCLHQGVNPSIGNYVTSVTDVQIASAGLPVELTRTYNSMDTREGAFGIGWSTFLDLSATAESGARLLLSFPDGHQERYGQNPDGSWASPSGNASVLRSASGGGWELQRPDRTTYVFNASGQPTAIRDGWGHELTLHRDTAGRVDRVMNALAGRYMELTWAADGPDGADVITQVQTNPASAGEPAPTWTYSYSDGGRLKDACAPGEDRDDPETPCTVYSYYGTGAGAAGKLHSITRQEGNVAVELDYQSDGSVAWVENGTNDRWLFSDDDDAAEGTYHPIAGWRAQAETTVNANASLTVDVTGSGGVPDTGVQAVVVDIQAAALGSGWFGVYPSGTPEPPSTSTMDYSPGYRSTLHTVAVGDDGKIRLTNHGSGGANVSFDVVGWYAKAGTAGGSVFVPTPTGRVYDSRASGAGGRSRRTPPEVCRSPVRVTCRPTASPRVVYDLQMVSATALTNLTAYASDATQPSISTAVTSGGLVDNLHVTAVGADGKIKIHNSAGSVDVVVDVVGYFADPSLHEGSVYRPVTGQRLLDTRRPDGQWTTPWPAGATRPITVAGEGPLPARGVTGVVGDVQGLAPTTSHLMRSGPAGAANAGTTYVAQASQSVGNHLYSGVAANGAFDLYSQQANDVLVDVVGYFTPVPRTAYVEDPRGGTVEYRYDSLGRLVGRVDQAGYATAWAYDDDGFVSSVRDPQGDGRRFSYDEEGHLVAETQIRLHGDPFLSDVVDWESTTYYGYVDDPANPARDGKLAWVADGRSADAGDTSYRTTYTYDDHGQPLTVRGPALPDAPDGVGSTRTYAAGGTQPAGCPGALGAVPDGLQLTETDAAGLTTTLCYDAAGDLREVHRPSGLVSRYEYDDLGRPTSHTEVSDSFPSGVTTIREYDARGRVTTETGPAVTSAIPNLPDGQTHRARLSTTYTPNGNVDRMTVTDVETDEARWVDYGYDDADRVTGTVDNADRTTSRTYDQNGNVAIETGVDGQTLAATYTGRDLPFQVTAQDVVYDPVDAPGTTQDILLSTSYYNSQGRPYAQVDASGLTSYYHWQPTGQLAHTTYRDARDTDPDTGLAQGAARTALESATQIDRAGNMVAAFAPSNVSHLDGFTGTSLDGGWQTSGAWTVADDELTAGGVGAMAWRSGARDGQVGLTVGNAPALSVLFRVEDEQNYLKLEWVDTVLWVKRVVDGVEDNLGGNIAAAPTSGTRIEVNFTGDRLRVLRNGALVMDTGVPDDIPGTGVGVVAMAAGQGADRFRFDAYQRTESTYDAYGRPVASTVDPGGADLRTEAALLPDGRPRAVYQSNAGGGSAIAETRYSYDPSSGFLESVGDVVADPDSEIGGDEVIAGTSYTHDQRGLTTQVLSAEGAEFDYQYDELGQLARVTGPPRTVSGYGQADQLGVRPAETYAHSAFGEPVAVQDAAGRVTTLSYDDRGFVDEVDLPDYTPPGGTSPVERSVSATYDDAGRVLAETDPLGATTENTYNSLGQLVARRDPAAGGDPAGVWRFVSDRMGRLLELRDPTGAVTRQRYDNRGRQTASEEIVRQPTLASYVSAAVVGDAGEALRTRSAEGVVSTSDYDLAGRLTSTTDADGNPTVYGYDDLGRPNSVTTPDGREVRTLYDLVGNVTAERLYSAGETLLDQTRHRYDLDNHLVQTWSPRGVTENFSTSYAYDAAGQLTGRHTPVAPGQEIVESWGYDVLGQAVRYTDGRNNTTRQTYNVMGLPEDAIEPAAGTHAAVTDRRWRSVYDAAGQPVTQQAPGGITVASDYDALGRLIEQSGSGAQAQTATRTFDYDQVDRLVSASTSAGAQTFTYDDRGLMLTADGVAGDSSFAYDGDGRLTHQVDSAGTTDLTYDDRGLPDTMASSLSGTVSYDFDESGRPATVDYGDGTARAYAYDDWGRVDTDVLSTGTSVLYGLDYGYDPDSNITSKNVTGTNVPAAGNNQYTYDQASRITGWTNPANTTEAYGWDAASNRTQTGTTTATYDEQNRLVTAEGPEGRLSNTWLANGTLDQQRTERRVSLVVANPASPTQAENALVLALTANGGVVTLVDDAAAAPTSGTDVVVLSPNVNAATIADKYKNVAVPVVSFAGGTWQATGLTSAAPTSASSTSATVNAAGHQIAAGKTGTVNLVSSADTITAAPASSLGAGATRVWTRSSSSTDAVVTAYDTGGATPGGAAPARRVAIGLSDGALAKLTSDGAALVTAAIAWADDNDATLGTTNFDFDAFEQLSRIATPDGTTTNQAYDPLGRRLDSPTGALSYAGGEIRPSADGANRYQRGPLGATAIDDTADGGGRWAHTDQHTDVVGAFSPGTTTLAGSQSFDPWGQPLGTAGAPVPLGYQSERQDLPGGLIGMGVREYDPNTATFVSHDPIADPAVPNGYSYTPANPLMYVDTAGTQSCTPVWAFAPCPKPKNENNSNPTAGGKRSPNSGQGRQSVGDALSPAGGSGNGSSSQGSGRSGSGRRASPPYRTPDSVIRNGPSTPAPHSATATAVLNTGSAVPNYPGRYQTDPSTGQQVDTGNASIPTTPVVPQPTGSRPGPGSPEINPTTLPEDSPIQFNQSPTSPLAPSRSIARAGTQVRRGLALHHQLSTCLNV